MSDIATELRAACAAIIKRHYGLPGALAAIKLETVERIDAYIERTEDRLARCTCDHGEGFQIDTSRDTPAYVALERARVDRLLFETESV